jgi:hypothetical protein
MEDATGFQGVISSYDFIDLFDLAIVVHDRYHRVCSRV